MIIQPTIEIMVNGLKCNRLYNSGNPYFFCTHNTIWINSKSEEPITSVFDSGMLCFGAENIEELEAEINRLGLT